ncbi:hypothetical protein Scep_009827 [Stephania cephalantha]|uniref:Uncharacterized protein n=1 Tax=Stephania cephalantha TaxID=152367 RepID=A0AAP0JUB2_9MAGN
MFRLIHTKQCNRLGHERLRKLGFVHYNMRLRVKNVRSNVELTKPSDPNDLTNIFLEEGDENPLYEWVKEAGQPLMDEPEGRPNTSIASEMGVNVDTLLEDEDAANARGLLITSISESNDDFATQANQPRYETKPGDDDGSGGDDDNVGGSKDNSDGGNDNHSNSDGGGGAAYHQGRDYSPSQRQMSPFSVENRFVNITQDSNHGSRNSDWNPRTAKKYSRKKRGYAYTSKSLTSKSLVVDSMTSRIGDMSFGSSDSHRNAFLASTYHAESVPDYSYNYVQPTGWEMSMEQGSGEIGNMIFGRSELSDFHTNSFSATRYHGASGSAPHYSYNNV